MRRAPSPSSRCCFPSAPRGSSEKRTLLAGRGLPRRDRGQRRRLDPPEPGPLPAVPARDHRGPAEHGRLRRQRRLPRHHARARRRGGPRASARGAREPGARRLRRALLALFAAALVVNLNLTALTCALAGAAVLLVVLYRRRAALPIAGAVAAARPRRRGATPPCARAPPRSSTPAAPGDWDIAALLSRRSLGRRARDDAGTPADGLRPGHVRRGVRRRTGSRPRSALHRRFVSSAAHELLRARRTATTSRCSPTRACPRGSLVLAAGGVPLRDRRPRGVALEGRRRPPSCSPCSRPGRRPR